MKDSLKSKKQLAIINTGKELFWKFGIKRVSIEEICKKATVSKMTFYKYFPNKIELAKYILDEIMEEAFSQYHGIVDSNDSFKSKVERMMRMKMEGTKDISVEFLNDVYATPENGLIQLIEHAKERSLNVFVQFLELAKVTGDIRQDINIDFVLYQLNLMTQTVNDPVLLHKYESPNQLIMESMRFLFYGLMPIDAES